MLITGVILVVAAEASHCSAGISGLGWARGVVWRLKWIFLCEKAVCIETLRLCWDGFRCGYAETAFWGVY